MKKLSRVFFLFLFSLCLVSPVLAKTTKPVFEEVKPKSTIEQAKDELTSFLSGDSAQDAKNRLVQTALVIFLGYLVCLVLIWVVNRQVVDIKSRHLIRKYIVYFVSFILLNFTVFIWIHDIQSLTIIVGVASAGLALALQEVVVCIAGWLLILIRHPFTVGDRIEIGGIKGDVIDIRFLQTSVLELGNWVEADQSTGRIVNIPNSFVFKHANYNYSRGFEFVWDEMPILITFESDWRVAKQVLEDVVSNVVGDAQHEEVQRKIKAMADRYMIYYGKLTPIVYTKIKDSGVELTIRYLTEAKRRRFNSNALSEAVLEAFAQQPHVEFAYPTYRIVKE